MRTGLKQQQETDRLKRQTNQLTTFEKHKKNPEDDQHNDTQSETTKTRIDMEHKVCKLGKHRKRDNKFGVTWCTLCGRLFSKPCGRKLKQE